MDDIEKLSIPLEDIPYYPLIRVINQDNNERAIIIAGDHTQLPLKVYLGNIYGLHGKGIRSTERLRDRLPCIQFKTIEDFFSSGWNIT